MKRAKNQAIANFPKCFALLYRYRKYNEFHTGQYGNCVEYNMVDPTDGSFGKKEIPVTIRFALDALATECKFAVAGAVHC